jgi:hypothetical protein
MLQARGEQPAHLIRETDQHRRRAIANLATLETSASVRPDQRRMDVSQTAIRIGCKRAGKACSWKEA